MTELHVVKIGGALLEDAVRRARFLDAFAALPAPRILVHGGGRRASEVSRALGLTPKLIDGRRITDADTLEVVTMVYGGLVNKRLVAELAARGCAAVGLSGADADLVRAHRRPVRDGIDYGYAGDVDAVGAARLGALLDAGLAPVLCPLTHDGAGQLLNTNADTIAREVAAALTPHYRVRLRYCFERPGVLADADDDDSALAQLTTDAYRRLRASGAVHSGMIPKLDNAFAAVDAGAHEVVVGDESLTGGTRLVAAAAMARNATGGDTRTPLGLLRTLVRTPSLSGREAGTAGVLAQAARQRGLHPELLRHNLVVRDPAHDPARPTLLLCSHHDTVAANAAYTRDPHDPGEDPTRVWGLGSNDAGGCAVALLQALPHLYAIDARTHNVTLALVAEEETSGAGGLRGILADLGPVDLAVVGEPTGLRLAVAERGLIVLDGVTRGTPGHAAHGNTVNPVALAARDIAALEGYAFAKTSETLGPVRVTVTQVAAGTQHNVVPAECRFVVDARVNERYGLEEVVATLRRVVAHSELTPRSLRNAPSGIPAGHPLVRVGASLGAETYGSPTLSDQAALRCPSVKCGPGDSRRSHQADEYLQADELSAGIAWYEAWLGNFLRGGT